MKDLIRKKKNARSIALNEKITADVLEILIKKGGLVSKEYAYLLGYTPRDTGRILNNLKSRNLVYSYPAPKSNINVWFLNGKDSGSLSSRLARKKWDSSLKL